MRVVAARRSCGRVIAKKLISELGLLSQNKPRIAPGLVMFGFTAFYGDLTE